MSYLRQITPWTRAAIGVLALAAAAIAVTVATASGSDSEGEDEAPDEVAVAIGPDPEAFEEFRDCMSEQGVDVPEPFEDAAPVPGVGPPEAGTRFHARPPGLARPDSATREAFEACADVMPRPPQGARLDLPPRHPLAACAAPGPPPVHAMPED